MWFQVLNETQIIASYMDNREAISAATSNLNIVRLIIEYRDSYRANFTCRHRKLRSV